MYVVTQVGEALTRGVWKRIVHLWWRLEHFVNGTLRSSKRSHKSLLKNFERQRGRLFICYGDIIWIAQYIEFGSCCHYGKRLTIAIEIASKVHLS